MMFIKSETLLKIYQHIYQEGVMVAKKEFGHAKHFEINVPNVQVIKAMQSLESRGYVSSRFSWGYYYYTLTLEGIEYLKEYLSLPSEIIPRTLLRQQAPNPENSGPRDRGMHRDHATHANEDVNVPMEKSDLAQNWRTEAFRSGVGRGTPA